MERYYVNKNAQANGDHEVHKESCLYLPTSNNLIYLGMYSSCKLAVVTAKEYYRTADGCYYCCNECHKR